MKTPTRSSLSIVLILSGMFIISAKAKAELFDRPDFFEKGYDEFEAEIRSFERGEETPIVPLDIEGEALLWLRIINDSSKFTALFPSETMTQEIETAENADGAIGIPLFLCQTFAVAMTKFLFFN